MLARIHVRFREVEELKGTVAAAAQTKAKLEGSLVEAEKVKASALAKYAALRTRRDSAMAVANSLQAVGAAADPQHVSAPCVRSPCERADYMWRLCPHASSSPS